MNLFQKAAVYAVAAAVGWIAPWWLSQVLRDADASLGLLLYSMLCSLFIGTALGATAAWSADSNRMPPQPRTVISMLLFVAGYAVSVMWPQHAAMGMTATIVGASFILVDLFRLHVFNPR